MTERPNQGSDISFSSGGKERKKSSSLVGKVTRPLIRHPVVLSEVLLAIAAGAYGAIHGIPLPNGEDNSSPPPATRDIGSVPGDTSFSNDGPQIVPSEQVKQPDKVNKGEGFVDKVKREIKNLNSSVIKAKKFEKTPPNRTPSEDMSPQYIPIDQLSTIKEYTAEYSPDGTYNNFQTGIGFILEERSEPYITRRVTANGIELIKTEDTLYPAAGVVGYTIGKEIQPDGSVFLAVYVPGENGLSDQIDFNKSLLFVENSHGDGGKIYNAIVWVKAEHFKGYSLPFVFNSVWNENSTNRYDESKKSNIPEELFRYIEVGDPLRASGAMLQIIPGIEDLLVQNYQERKNHLTYDEAQEKYLSIVNNNAETIQRMLKDAKTGGVTLEEQLKTKRYVLQVSGVSFVPRD